MAVIPTPYYLEAPGRALDLDDLFEIEEFSKVSEGRILLPTVISEPATLLYCAVGLFDPSATLTRRSSPGLQAQTSGGPDGEPHRGQDRQMQLSQYFGARTALKALGYDIDDRVLGFQLQGVDSASPNAGLFEPGDIIVEVAGNEFQSLSMLSEALASRPSGSTLPLLVRRGSSSVSLEAHIWDTPVGPRLGVLLTPRMERAPLPVQIEFRSTNTVGASGGLAFGVAIYDRLWGEGALIGDRVVAISGTLEPDGSVRAVEGLRFKAIAAERAGATVLLYPAENEPEMKEVKTYLRSIPVRNFEEALIALKN